MDSENTGKVKKKIKRRKMWCGILLIFLILMIALFIVFWQKKQTDTVSDDVVLKEGQYFIYGQITAINGNEVVYDEMILIEQESKEALDEAENQEVSQGTEGERTERLQWAEGGMQQSEGVEGPEISESEMPKQGSGERPELPEGMMSQRSEKAWEQSEGMGETTEQSEGETGKSEISQQGSGERSEMSGDEMWQQGSGERPELPEDMMSQRSEKAWEQSEGMGETTEQSEEETGKSEISQQVNGERPELPEDMMPQQGSGERPGDAMLQHEGVQEESQYELTGESITVQIPVGTQVTTKLGTVTTFSRLAAGDAIKMLVQEENGEPIVLEVWIIE